MAEGTVDNLNIQLSADADQAVKSLDNLASTLRSINTAFAKDISGMRSFSKEIGTLTYAMKELNNVKVSAPDLSKISKAIKGLGETKTSAAKSTANDVKDIVNSLKGIGNVNFNESGVTKLTNSLKRLVQVDMSAFDVTKFKEITDAVSTLGNMPDVSSGVNKFVSSLSRLANAGAKTGEAANDIRRLGEQTRLAVQELSSIGAINDDVNMFVQSIGRLASAGSKTSQTASGLSALSKETLDFFKTMQNAPKISQNTIAMTQALAQLASAGGRVGTATGQTSSAFSRLSNLSSKAGSIVSAAGKKIVSTFKSIGDSGKHINKAGNFLTDFIKGAVLYQGVTGLIDLAKSSIDLGSSITEVENVVDVSFGNMAQSAYDFASTAKEQFGLSELAAKQYSGTMMAMLKSSGVAQDAAAEMSTTLAGLAGDLASFYNIETDEAFYKLRAAISGEVEPLRQLGINMTVANMEAYALSQGITKSWQSMTQAEQVMLRYNYIMSATSQQQNDYSRTVNSFANQLRLLTLNFQTLQSTIGQGFIAAILPAIQGLNALMSALQRVAEAFRTFMYTLTGYEPQGSQSGIVNDLAGIGDVSTGLENIGSAGGDAADGMDDASDSAEDLKDSLSVLSFDELNQLASAATSAGDALKDASSGAGGLDDINVPGTGSGISTDLGDLPLDTQPISAWAKRIRDAFLAEDWDRLGYEIADGLNRGLQKVYDVINWKNVGPKITAFTSAFTQTFNSLVDNIDWELLGRTIGTGFNTIVNTLNQLIEGINWVNLGSKFGEGFMGLVDEIDWYEFGRLIGNKFMIAWDLFSGFVEDLDFAKIGSSIAEGINGAIDTINLKRIGSGIGKTVNGIFEMLQEFADDLEWEDIGDSIADGINSFFKRFKFSKLSSALNSWTKGLLRALTRAVSKIDWGSAFGEIIDFVGNLDLSTAFIIAIPAISKLNSVLKQIDISPILTKFQSFKNLFNGNFFGNLVEQIQNIRSQMNILQKGVIGVVSVFTEFAFVKDAFYDIASGSKSLISSLSKIAVGAGAAAAALKLIGLSNPLTAIITAATALGAAFIGINSAMNDVAENSMFETLRTTGNVTLEDLGNVATESFGKITSGVDASIEKFNQIQNSKESIDQTTQSIDSMRTAIDNGAFSASEKVPQIIEQFQSLLDQSKSIFEEEYNTIVGNVVGAWADILTAQGESVPEVVAQLASLRDEGTTAYSDLESSIQELIEQYNNGSLSAEDFYEKSMPLFDQLRSFNDDGAVDQTTQAIKDLGGSLDLSQYITDDSFDTSAFQSYMDTVTQTAKDGQENLKTLGEQNDQTLQDYKKQLESLGIDTSKFDWASLYGASDEQVSTGISNIDNAYQDYADQIQYALLNQLPAVVEDATKDYEKLNPFQKIFTSKEDYVNDAISSWKDGILTPVTSSIQDGFEQLGIDGNVWADDAAGKLVNSIFQWTTTYSTEGIPVMTESLKSDWETILSDSLAGAAEAVDASSYGKNTVEGYNSGITENAQSSYDKIKEWMNGIDQNIHDSSMQFGSPSKTAEQYGIDTVEGYNQGILDSLPSTKKSIESYMETVRTSIDKQSKIISNSLVDSLSDAWSSIKKEYDDVGIFFKSKFSDAYKSVTTAWNPINNWFLNKWNAIKNVFSPSVINSFKDWFQTAYTNTKNIWEPANTWFLSKWNAIKNVFSPDVQDSFRTWFQLAYINVTSAWAMADSWFSIKWASIKNVFADVNSFFTSGFQTAYNSITNIWSGLGDFFRNVASNAFAPIKKLVNGIISGVNWVLKEVDSGTRLSSWGGVAFKGGSDGLARDTLGVVNDQKGSTYKELIVPPNGNPFIPKGRNVTLPLEKGTKIMPAKETKKFMSSLGIPKFAEGIGNLMGWKDKYSGDMYDYLGKPDSITRIALDKFTDISGIVGVWKDVAHGMVNKVFSGVSDFISNIFEDVMPTVKYNPSAGVEQWRSLAAQALRMEGQYSPSNLNLMLFQMQTESSGNPNAINLWDSNAKRGTPSKGLMQVIDPTFRAYARPGYNSNIWDPLSNMLASIRYTVRRYGSLARGWRGHGYAEGIGTITLSDLMGGIPFLAKGGLITSPTLAFTGENFRKEAVLPLENSRTMGMIADSIVSNSSDGLGLSKAEIQQAVAEGVVMAMMNNQGNQPNITVYAELKTENDEVLARAVTRGQQKIDYRMNPVGT